LIISKYVHRFPFDGYTAYYHSLRMKPVFLTTEEAEVFEEAMRNGVKPPLSNETLEALKEYLIVTDSDEGIIDYVRSHVPDPYICLAYFVLSEQCNLACKYCFLGNADIEAPKVTKYPMSHETADKALAFFARQTREDMSQFNDEKEIIFYGGEPLVNFDTLKYVVERSRYYQEQHLLGPKLKFSMITNGTLLNEEIVQFLIDHKINVSISIDGADEAKNSNRVLRAGGLAFPHIIRKLRLAQSMGLRFGLSITLSEETIKDVQSLINLLDDLDVDSVCFNILLKSKNFGVEKNYYINATDFIIDFYEKTKDKGVYEDRFMRKLKAFAESGLYFSDCAATSGSQIVITPDGQVGICHGAMEKREHFIGSIDDENLVVGKNAEVNHWNHLSPVFKEECQNCEALGICGGGCPVNAQKLNNTASIDAIDKAFCIHAKKVLEYLIGELLKYSVREAEECV
jgi:uncharacterized protein